MAPLACLLQEQGHRVRGADGPLYPPMSTLLAEAGIEPHVGYDPRHVVGGPEPPPDLVVVGNAVARSNPEAEAVEAAGIERISMPQALARFFLAGRRPLVAAGTHGKTTTTALAAWVYSDCGTDPGYLVGGVPLGLPASFHAGTGERFVIEGDEYNAAYFDRGPKFLHYQAETLILTSVEHDHADLYPDPQSLLDAYGRLLEQMPAEGLAVVCGDSAELRALIPRAGCRVITYGLGEDNDVHPLGAIEERPGGSRFRVADPPGVGAGGGGSAPVAGEGIELRLAIPGRHNAENALAVWTVARLDGLPAERVAASLAAFRGVKRRQEELAASAGVTVVDDFAHHPTAVGRTLEALAGRYPGRRLVVCFEPRSLTAGRAHLEPLYRQAFTAAGRVLFAPTYYAERFAADELLDFAALAADLRAGGLDARAFDSVDALHESALAEVRPGDVLISMSSGAFEGLPHRLAAAVRAMAA